MSTNHTLRAHAQEVLDKSNKDLRVAVSREEKWQPTILRLICL